MTLTTLFGASLSGGRLGEHVFGAIQTESRLYMQKIEHCALELPSNSLSHALKRELPGLQVWPEFSGEKNRDLRETKKASHNVTSTSSIQSSATRVSTSVALPANLRAPVPKTPATLAELDLFFSDSPIPVPLPAETKPETRQTEKPSMDFAEATNLFRN